MSPIRASGPTRGAAAASGGSTRCRLADCQRVLAGTPGRQRRVAVLALARVGVGAVTKMAVRWPTAGRAGP